jgi:hypothetical protein
LRTGAASRLDDVVRRRRDRAVALNDDHDSATPGRARRKRNRQFSQFWAEGAFERHNRGSVAGDVIGRDSELALIDEMLATIRAGPAALVFTGDAGIGKTVLWDAGLGRARTAGCSILSCRCAEGEAALAFGALTDLVAPVFDDVAPWLAPPRRRALETALLLTDPRPAAPRRASRLVGTARLVAPARW